MVSDLGSSRGERTTSKVGFCRGNMQEGLASSRLLLRAERLGVL